MLTIIIKGTNGCNLACSYCSLGEKKNFKYVNKQTLEDIFIYSCKYARKRKETTVNFILHGGEPTLIEIDVYKFAIDSVKRQFSDLEILISMQSNGFMITDEFIEFIHEYDIHIGISIDGSEEIHDLERCSVGKEPTYRRVVNNIENMKDKGIKVSCLMVLTQNAIGKGYEYLRFFEKKHIHLKINPLLNYGEVYEHPELTLHSGDYAKYLIGLYEYSIEKDIAVTISPNDNILQAILNNQRMCECSFNKECNKHFLCIDYKGDVYPCGKFSDMDIFKLGNIYDKSEINIEKGIMQKLTQRKNNNIPLKCRKCKYLYMCNGGCSAEAVIDGDFNAVPILCEDYKMLFEYFSKDGLILLRKELERQKRVLEAK